MKPAAELLLRLLAEALRNQGPTVYRCGVCGSQQFANEDQLRQHVRDEAQEVIPRQLRR